MSLPMKASKGFLRAKVDTQISAGLTISNCLIENESEFKNLPTKGADLLKKNQDFTAANNLAKSGDKTAKANLKTVRVEWKEMFGKTADAVSLDANGSEAMILKAGMTPTSSTSRKKQQPAQPANTTARPTGGKGVCTIMVDAQPGVNGYVGILTATGVKMEMIGDTVKIIPDGNPIYIQARSRRDVVIEGLPSHAAFCATMFVFNSAGSSPLGNSEEMATQ